MKQTRAVALVLALSVCPAAARGNGRFPAAQHVVVGPGTASRIVALRTTFGMALSTDGGRTFAWMCEEGMYFPFVPAMNFDAPIEVASRGAVVFGYEAGLRYTADGCKADDVRVGAMHAFSDLTADPTGRVVYAIQADDGVANAVYRGDGDSMDFTRLGAGVRDVLFDTIEVAPSDTRRLYLTGRATDAFVPLLYRSDDGGATLARVTTDMAPADSYWVSAVDPRDPDVLYMRAAVGFGTELRRSRDAGRTFQRIAATRDPMLGFAMSDDGRTLWYGSIAEGVFRSDDGGESFGMVARLPVICLRQHAGVLWACSDWINRFALGRSMDGGATFEPVLRFNDPSVFVGPPRCDVRSEGADICVERWPAMQRSLADTNRGDAGVSADAGRRDAATDAPGDATSGGRSDAGMDATPDAASFAPTPGSCGCVTRRPEQPGALWAVLVATVLRVRRRRARG